MDEVKPYVDSVLTFEELQALFDSRNIEITTLEETNLDNASYFGRIFARSGGLTDAAAQAMKEQNIDFEIKPVVCDGIEACRMALLKLNKGILDGNFIEGMACIGGCIGRCVYGCIYAYICVYGCIGYNITICVCVGVVAGGKPY